MVLFCPEFESKQSHSNHKNLLLISLMFPESFLSKYNINQMYSVNVDIFETPGIHLYMGTCIFEPQKAKLHPVLLCEWWGIHIWKESNEFAVQLQSATHISVFFFQHNHYHSMELTTATTATIWEKHMQRRHTLPIFMHRKKNHSLALSIR